MNEYYENPALSQSKLKLLLGDPSKFNTVQEPELYFEEKTYFVIGSAVDYCLTQPDKEFSDAYHVSNLENKPSDTMKSIINMVFDNAVEQFGVELRTINDADYEELILDAVDSHAYQPRWTVDTKYSKVCENWEYWEDLKQAHGKVVLSQEEANLVDSIVMSIRTNEATSKYFNKEEIKFQVPIYFECMDVNCKALLDMVIFDRKNKTIQPIDIKTMGDEVIYFPNSLRKRRYDIQAAFYVEALKWLYPDYEILPFKFIVESTVNPGNPIVFTVSKELLTLGKFGRKTIILTGLTKSYDEIVYHRLEEIKGFFQLIELYKYYTEKGFDKDQIVRENDSELKIDWSGIVV